MNELFHFPGIGFKIFFGIFIVLIFVTSRIYENSANIYDYIIEDIKPSLINISIWTTFWISWSIYNLIILFSGGEFSFSLATISALLTHTPGLIIFFFTYATRKAELADLGPEVLKEDSIAKIYEGDQRSASFRYYSGFYGVITIPIHTIACIVYYYI
jgi:hypothetical protein